MHNLKGGIIMHYHIYSGTKTDAMPEAVFNFTSGQQAIDKVMELIESLGQLDELVEVVHTENKYGRFSTIEIPNQDHKIVLHECSCEQNNQLLLNNKNLN
jgi:hypothetical protein